MKMTCESCLQRYQIPDHRAVGKVLKVRCTRCKYVMQVVGPTHAYNPHEDQRPPTLTNAQAFRPDAAPMSPSQRKPTWWVGIRGKPHGPYRDSELVDLCERGDVHARSYAWRKGFTHWSRLCEIPDLSFALEAVFDAALTMPDPFEQVAMLSDGHGHFPDPTLKSGWLVLDERTQAHLETLAAQGQLGYEFTPEAERRENGAATAAFFTVSGLASAVMGAFVISQGALQGMGAVFGIG